MINFFSKIIYLIIFYSIYIKEKKNLKNRTMLACVYFLFVKGF